MAGIIRAKISRKLDWEVSSGARTEEEVDWVGSVRTVSVFS